MSKQVGRRKRTSKPDQERVEVAKLDKLVEEATVDCYNRSEEITGLFTMIEGNLELPFKTDVLGVRVMVIRVDLTDAEEIVVICTRGRARQAIPLLELPLPVPPPPGAEWIDAYRHWACGGH